TWRERRRLTQLDLSGRAQVSARHLSFVETGRSRPSSEMILLLAEQLDVPLRERNQLLLAAGYAPAYPEHALTAPPMSAVNTAVNAVLAGHDPMPAAVVDRHWELVAGNRAAALFMAGAAAPLLEPPVNVLRLSQHPGGMAPRIVNLAQWRAHLLERLQRQVDATGDQVLRDLYGELAAYPVSNGEPAGPLTAASRHAVVVPLRYRVAAGELSLFSMSTVFGTPNDVTVAELAIESFYPADEDTARLLRTIGEAADLN
nr:helix-turn-helix transcriptional regulator [Micromonospora sp. DSM 115978]